MKMKKWLAGALTACMLLGFAGCGEEGAAVYVQPVADVASVGSIALGDKFPGMIVSENVTEIQRDMDKTVAELNVKEGDDVTEGQELFSYDSDELQLTLDKQKLELEQLEATVENYKDQIATLEKERKNAPQSSQLQYTVQIQTYQVDQKEAEMNITAKKAEIAQTEKLLENVTVVSPVSGRVQSINENGMDNYGNPLAYITIQQAGSYRVKATLGELQRGGIMEGTRMKIISRMDSNEFWTGTVTLVDYENATQGNSTDMYYGMATDSMSASSKYPFYVELDSADGLILGQHVYLEVDSGSAVSTGLQLPSYFVCSEDNGDTYVWAENKAKLEKRAVTLGSYDEMMDTYEIVSGLTEEDYIAFPDEELCKAGAPTTHEYVEPEGNEDNFVDDGFVDDGFVDDGFVDDGFVDGGLTDEGFVDGGVMDEGLVEGENSEDAFLEDSEESLPEDNSEGGVG